jgi:hypothetical protein
LLQARCSRDATFNQLQQSLRLHWQQLQQQPHVVLHLPSMPVEQQQQQQQQQLSPSGGQARPCQQQHQLWRVLDVVRQQQQQQQQRSDCVLAGAANATASTAAAAASKSVVALVMDQPVSKQLQAHWMQLLRRAGVQDPEAHIRYRLPSVSKQSYCQGTVVKPHA